MYRIEVDLWKLSKYCRNGLPEFALADEKVKLGGKEDRICLVCENRLG